MFGPPFSTLMATSSAAATPPASSAVHDAHTTAAQHTADGIAGQLGQRVVQGLVFRRARVWGETRLELMEQSDSPAQVRPKQSGHSWHRSSGARGRPPRQAVSHTSNRSATRDWSTTTRTSRRSDTHTY